MPFRLLCADESHTVRLGIEALCRTHGCPIDRFVSSFQELEQVLKDEHYDAIITDVRLGNENMLEYVGGLVEQSRDFRAILYTDISNPTIVAQAVANRFFDVVFQSGTAAKLVRSIQSLETGKPTTSSPLLRFQEFMRRRDWKLKVPGEVTLTRREIQVLTILSFGLSNREIGAAIQISLETVKEHLQNLFRKLNLHDRTAVAVWAIKNDVPTAKIEPMDLE